MDFVHGQSSSSEICVMRLICHCGHTHAVLPDLIIPYCSYGLFFILRVLAEFFCGFSTTIDRLCERFSITRNQFYKWRQLWKEHKELWLGVLGTVETTDARYIRTLVLGDCYSDFASMFVRRFSVSFLQAHRNPASSRHRLSS